MFERPKGKESAVLVHLNFEAADTKEDIAEFRELAISAGARPVAVITGARHAPEAKYFVGTGKAEEIRACVAAEHADLVLFNHSLTPAQERNLERLVQCRVLDRTGLILDIFAQRARTFEGKLQVELAQLQHLATHLVRGWTHLERQKGGIGLRGPGETQLETDRRLVRNRIKFIEKRLEKVKSQRQQSRRSRVRAAVPTVSLVGYTNAGKSTLFNKLTGADVYVANQLFATLDPTLRRAALPNASEVVVADTVGFIRHLPHDLVEAFHATLEETKEATLLLHVIDASDSEKESHAEQVEKVLAQIQAENVPKLLVFNKVDLISERQPRMDRDKEGRVRAVWLSAVTSEGIELLQQALVELLYEDAIYHHVKLSPTQGKLRATLYQLGAILSEDIDKEGNSVLSLRMHRVDFEKWFN